MVEVKPKRALGRGLSSLLDDISEEINTSKTEEPLALPKSKGVDMLPISSIGSNPDQPRRYFDDDKLSELTDSIRQKGVIQPILVRPSPRQEGEYEIIAGERRWRAAQKARLHEVPVVIKELNDVDAFEIAIIENVQRADLNAMEEALAYKQLIDKYDYTQETLARNLGKSRAHVANMVRLLNLPEDVQDYVKKGKISAGHARAVLMATDPTAFAEKIIKKQLSVRAAEKALKAGGSKLRGVPFVQNDASTRAIEDELSSMLQMRVSIRQKGEKGGEIAISYRSLDDLEEIRGLLSGDSRQIYAS
jgi:ParB family chromosome partitioning protein